MCSYKHRLWRYLLAQLATFSYLGALTMAVLHANKDQIDALMAIEDDAGPFLMLNLLRFHTEATYRPEDNQAPCSGAEAYARYGEATDPIMKQLGGTMRLLAGVELSVIAPEGEQWDQILIVEWPNAAAFKGLLRSKDYRAISFHRDAAVADSRLIVSSQKFNGFK
jgi:uncharacterized protein (DUF1330 family)